MNGYVSWPDLAPLLGAQTRSGAYPASSDCPLCGGRLVTYQCTTGNGQWHRCLGCSFAGDSIELAAAAWGLSIPAAVTKLRTILKIDTRFFTERAAAGYEERFLQGRRRNNEVWQRARDYKPSSNSELRGLHTKLKFPEPPTLEAWRQRGGQYVGAMERDLIEEILWVSRESRHNPFKYSHWKVALILPLYDLPGRICSFVVAANDYKNNVDTHLRFVLPLADHRLYRPGGVSMPELLDLPPGASGDRVLVLLNPLAALQLQVRHLANQSQPLPIVGAWEAANTPAMLLEHSTAKQLTIWAPVLDKAVFRHAVALNARVVYNRSQRQDLWEQLRTHEPHSWTEMNFKRAVTWEQALEDYLSLLNPSEAEEVLLYLDLPAHRLEEFVKGCRSEVRSRIEVLVTGRRVARKVSYQGHTIVEDSEGWTRAGGEKNGELICNASVRIERVVYQPSSSRSYYQGDITYKGEKIPFMAPKKEMDAAPGRWLEEYLLKLNKGVLVCNRQWTKDLLSIATLFHQPELVHSLDSDGWDGDRQSFIFPGFLVKRGGEVEDNTIVHQQPMPRPGLLTSMENDRLHGGPGVDLTWAVAVAVTARLVAPSANLPGSGVAVYGSGVEQALRLAEVMGCPSGPFAKEKLGGWPLVVRTNQVRNLCRVWLQESDHNCLWKCDELDAHALGCRGWTTLNTNGETEVSSEVLEAAARLVPCLVRQLAENLDDVVRAGLSHAVTMATQDFRAVNQMSSLFGGRVYERVLEGGYPLNVTEHFATLLCILFEAGELGFEHASYSHPRWKRAAFPSMAYLNGRQQMWVPKLGVNSILSFHQLPPVDVPAVTNALTLSRCLVGEEDYRDEPGWVVNESWWNEHIRRYRARNKKPREV